MWGSVSICSVFFVFKKKTAYEMRISDWSSDVCSSDLLGQVRGNRSELYEALETASAAQESPLSIIISTQAPTDADLLSVLIDDAKTQRDPRTKLVLYTADESLAPFSDERSEERRVGKECVS